MISDNYEKNNQVCICGTVEGESKFSYELYGEKFYECKIRITRLSGACDILPAVISERIMPKDWSAGKTVCAIGQFRSCNEIVDGRSKLKLYVFIREISDGLAYQNKNRINLTGFICKAPYYRTTPFNREITDVLIAVNRAYGKSDYIPAIAWGRNAKFAKYLARGERVALEGRIQSREYQKNLNGKPTTMTAYEVSISKICTLEYGEESPYKFAEEEVQSNGNDNC